MAGKSETEMTIAQHLLAIAEELDHPMRAATPLWLELLERMLGTATEFSAQSAAFRRAAELAAQ